jgi:isopenicillin N synthase-like dioxygenase
VPDEVIRNLRENIAEFFNLPLETKKAYSQLPNSLEGYGQAFVVSEVGMKTVRIFSDRIRYRIRLEGF